MAWRHNGTIHFASDSRLTVAPNSYADVAIKISALPITIYNPTEEGMDNQRAIAHKAVLGMCFAGSAVNSLTIKESVTEVLKSLKHIPEYTDISMDGIASFVFKVYEMISEEVSKTALGSNGLASILLGGYCTTQEKVRVFHLSTDDLFNYNVSEILTDQDYFFIGSGNKIAEADLPQQPTDSDYLNILKSVINDDKYPTVGGHIQYGCFKKSGFVVYGVIEFAENVHYWRGALDLNSEAFMDGHKTFVPGLPFIDPFSTIGGI